MPQPRYLTTDKARNTHAAYATVAIGDIDAQIAWQGDSLIWLAMAKGAPQSKHGGKSDSLVSRMQQAFPTITFTPAADQHHFADQIAKAWETDRLSDVQMTLYGTPFRHQVWAQLLAIPAGNPCTYGEIAARIGKPGASRAVGSAVGANPISLLVPCHRVLPHTGKVGSYGWGPHIKTYLLDIEKEHGQRGIRRAA